MTTVARQNNTGPKDLGNLTFEDKRIMFRNFSGVEGPFNASGIRSFCLALEPEEAQQMAHDGWNVKHLKPREEDEDGQSYVNVAVSFRIRPPRVVLITSRGRTTLPEELVSMLDWVDIANVDLIINPSKWEKNGNSGVKAYLKSIYITVEDDELERKYADVPDRSDEQLELPSSNRQLAIDEAYEYAEVVED